MKTKRSGTRRTPNAFTRLELTIVIATLTLMAAVTRPLWGSGGMPKSLMCMDNLRRLQSAWLLYADDNGGKYVGNYHGGFIPSPTDRERPWATGWFDWTTSSANTNRIYLTDPRYAALAPYLARNASLFKCPADNYLAAAQAARGWTERVRSYSMGCAMGEGNAATGPWNSSLLQVTSTSGFGKNRPQAAFVFIEEHPDSINDALLFVPQILSNLPDVPGSLHEGACWVTFADGHLELHPWQTAKLKGPVLFYGANNLSITPDNPDSQWLLDHTPKR